MRKALIAIASVAALVVCADFGTFGKLGAGFGRLGSNGNRGQLTGGIRFASGYPLDSVAATYTSACGVGALTASWKNGNLFDLVSPAVTIKAVGPGYPDVASLAAALGVSPTSGVAGASISKCYDQSGNGNNWVQSTSGSVQPMVWLINGKVYFGFSGILNGGTLTQPYFTIATSINNHSLSIFAAVTPYTSSNSGAVGQALMQTLIGTGSVGGGTAATDIAFTTLTSTNVSLTGMGANIYSAYGDATNALTAAVNPYIGIQPQIDSMVAGASSVTVAYNNTSASGIALVAGTPSPLLWGQFSGSLAGCGNCMPFSGRAKAMIISSSVFTGPQTSTMTTSLAGWSLTNLNVNKANHLNVVGDGASSDMGQGATPGYSNYGVISGGGYGYIEQLKDDPAFSGVSWHEFGVPGATIANRTTDYSSSFVQTSAFQASSTKNVLILSGIAGLDSTGTDAIPGPRTGAQAYSDYQAWLAAARSVGWTRIAMILYPPPGPAAQFVIFENLVAAGAATDNVDIIDARSVLPAGAPYVQADGHIAVAGDAIIAGLLKPYLQQF